jgi:Holliday junction resolvasome RuvABC endonuclease subunit
MILGLDISTAVIGYTVLDEKTGKILVCDAMLFNWKNVYASTWAKVRKFKKVMEELHEKYHIEYVFIEEALSGFSFGKTNIQTLHALIKFNGICSYVCKEVFTVDPEYFAPRTARKLYGVDLTQKKGLGAKKKDKEVVLQHVITHEPEFAIKLNSKGNLMTGTMDRSDSLVIARAGEKVINERQIPDSKFVPWMPEQEGG